MTARCILITGAGSGIGAGIAAELAKAGHHVVVTDVNHEAAATVTAQIRAALDKADAAFAAADNALADKDFVTYAEQIKLAQRYVSQALALADQRPTKKD